MLNSLKSPIHTIFIMLGQSCNFNCKYCMQHAEEGLHVDLPQDINPDIYDYISQQQSLRDPEDGPLNLHFYGGEPLLYFDNIKRIVEKTESLGVSYSFISNGYAITKEMVDFFNEHNFSETISWDGTATPDTRKIDVFSIPEKKTLLFQLKRLGVSAVYTAFAYPKQLLSDFQKLSSEYAQIHKYHMHVNIDELFDTGVSDRSLFNIDFDKISADMIDLLDDYYRDMKQDIHTNPARDGYLSGLINRAKWYVSQENNDLFMSTCGNGYAVVNMDLEGVFYNCHNSSDIIGSIYSYPGDILKNLLTLDHTKEYQKECRDCSVISICNGGCKLIDQKTREASYCKLKRAVFLPVIEFILKFSK